jgi:hypothetical protein
MSFATDNQTAGFAKVNPIATLVPPAQQAAPQQTQDVANAAHVLVAQFAQPESTQSRTRAIWTMATMLTVSEFTQAMDKALEQAKANDKAAGFTPASDAKGRDKYGPMQSTLATVASQCRQVFGACKIDPESIVSATPDGAVVNPDLFPNWSKAYEKARAFLADKGVDWTGNPVSEVKAARKAKAKRAASDGVEKQVKAQHPQMPGESMAQYLVRIAPMMDEAEEKAHATAVTEAAAKELTRLIKVYGDSVADILEAMVIRHNAMNGEESPM